MPDTPDATSLADTTADALDHRLAAGRPEFGDALDGLRARMHAVAAGGAAPRTVGRYRLGRVIGSGAFGTVHEAEDPELDRRVAVKLLAVRSSKEAARVVREAQLLATLSHPNIVQVFEVGTTDAGRSPYVVMELVEGPTLRQWLAEGPHPWRAVVEVVLAVAQGLWAAHQAGIIHRDLKPENVLMGRDGRPRVIDFGLARSIAEDGSASEGTTLRSGANELRSGSGGSAQLTATGQVMGTPAYMAPEVFAGEFSPQGDQYALCVTLYEALFGARPFVAESAEALARQVLAREVELPADRRGAPRRVVAIVRRGLRRRAQERYADLGALVVALERARQPSRWPGVAAGVGAVLGIGGVVVASMQRDAEPEPPPPEVCAVGDAAWARLREQAAIPAGLEVSLATYERTWRETEAALCEAGEGVIDWERRRCLDRGLRDVSALVSATADVDTKSIDLPKATRGLPSPADCAEAVRDELAPPPASLELGPLEDRLSQLEALAATAQIQAGLERSGPLLEDVRAAGYAPLLVEAMNVRARTLLLASDYEAARAMYEETFFLAQREGMMRFAARAADRLIQVTGYYLRDPSTAQRWVEHAEIAYRRAGIDPYARGSFLSTLGGLAEIEGNYAEATRLMRQAVAADIEAGYPKDSSFAGIVNHLGVVLFHAGEYHQAIAALREAAEIYEQNDGPAAPSRAAAIDNIGAALMELGHYRAAHAHHRAALEIREATLAADHVDLGASHGNMAKVLLWLQRADEALPHAERALALFSARLGSEHPYVGTAHELRGNVHEARGPESHALALRDYERAARLFEAAGPVHAATVARIRDQIRTLTEPAAPAPASAPAVP